MKHRYHPILDTRKEQEVAVTRFKTAEKVSALCLVCVPCESSWVSALWFNESGPAPLHLVCYSVYDLLKPGTFAYLQVLTAISEISMILQLHTILQLKQFHATDLQLYLLQRYVPPTFCLDSVAEMKYAGFCKLKE